MDIVEIFTVIVYESASLSKTSEGIKTTINHNEHAKG